MCVTEARRLLKKKVFGSGDLDRIGPIDIT
jgi:hypothetical protein